MAVISIVHVLRARAEIPVNPEVSPTSAVLGAIFRRPGDAKVHEARVAGQLVHPQAATPPA